MRSRVVLGLIIIITTLSILIDLPKLPIDSPINNFLERFPVKLGLDLQGGMELTLQTDMSKIDLNNRDDALISVKEVIEKRVNLFGVSESVVQTSKVRDERRILIELPGIKDASSAANLIGKTAELQFREMPATLSATQIESTKSGIPLTAFAIPTDLTGADLKKASVTFGSGNDGSSGPQVAIEFSIDGARKFAEITKRNIGKPLLIFLDNSFVSAPTVQQEIIGGSAVITGQFTTAQAKDLSIQLNAGALPVPVKILEQRSIGPTVGQVSINKSLVAAVIGLSVVALYMILYYGLLGVVAVGALILYTLFTLTFFKTGLFILPPVTLTLAGIAGFILSIGMAVDANILIFERMKEELRWGKSKLRSLELGFTRAWSSIWASNVSTLLTASILYFFGTSQVKGFAITLIIGVLISMFTAVVVTRTILRMVIKD